MARPEAPLNCRPRRRQLASVLREARARKGVTYVDMAAHAGGISPATLKRIASGNGPVPKWDNVLTYYKLCLPFADYAGSTEPVVDFRRLRDVWVLARKEERGTLHLKNQQPRYICDESDLSRALYVLYENAGAPSLRELQRRAGGPLHLPLATAARIVTRRTIPSDTPQFKAFIEACSVPEREVKVWLEAWYRVNQTIKSYVRWEPGEQDWYPDVGPPEIRVRLRGE
ncbi:helix-turn-helix domain-containing protein [Streptomyces sp. NPDC060235]|uniref:helix-turn-helix domain-containing protein n=1 Tax=Streptomyces sp. NPDC060235 TaxID=3347080 RepID=UPI003665EC95